MNVFLVYVAMDSPPHDGYSQGPGTISAVLKSKCHLVDYIVLKSAFDIKALVERCRTERPGVVAFSTRTTQFDYLKEICPALRVHYDGMMLCGGTYPTLCPECIEEIPVLDAIVRGEGEYPMLELAAAIDAGEDPTTSGNTFRASTAQVSHGSEFARGLSEAISAYSGDAGPSFRCDPADRECIREPAMGVQTRETS